MKRFVVLLLVALVAPPAWAQSVFELRPNHNPSFYNARTKVIDPDRSVYGVDFGSTEKQVLAALGDPTAVVALGGSKKGYLYGKSQMLVFRKGKLREMHVGRCIFDTFSKRLDDHPFFDRKDWELKPGIRDSMTFDQIREALGKPTAPPQNEYQIDGDRSITTLKFLTVGLPQRYGGNRPDAGSYRLFEFSIVHFGT